MLRWDEGLVEKWQPRLGQGFDPLALDLSVDEAYLLSLIDGQVSVAELCDRSGQSRSEVAVMLQRLIQLGVVDGADAPPDLGVAFDLKASLALEGLFDEPDAAGADGDATADDELNDDLEFAAAPLATAASDGELDSWDDDTSADNLVLPAEDATVEMPLSELGLGTGFDGPPDPTEVGSGDELAQMLEEARGLHPSSPTAAVATHDPPWRAMAADASDEPWPDERTPRATDLPPPGLDDQGLVEPDGHGDDVAGDAAAEWDLNSTTPPEVELEGLALDPATGGIEQRPPTPTGVPAPSSRHAPRALVPRRDDDDDDDEDDDAATHRPSPGAWYGRQGLPGIDGPEVDPEIVALPGGVAEHAGGPAPAAGASARGLTLDLVAERDRRRSALDVEAVEVDRDQLAALAGNTLDSLALDDDAFDQVAAAALAAADAVGEAEAEVEEQVSVLLLDGSVDDDEPEEEVVLVTDATAAGSSEGEEDEDEEEVVLPPARADAGAADDDGDEVELPYRAKLHGVPSEAVTQSLSLGSVQAAEAMFLDPPAAASADEEFVVIQEPARRSAADTEAEDAADGHLQVIHDISMLPVARGASLDPDVGPLDPEPAVHGREATRAPVGQPPAEVVEELPATALMPIDDDDPPFPSLEIATQALGTEGLVWFDDLSTMHLAERFNLVRTAEDGMLRALCLDPNPRVICELIAQPTFTVEHACLVARWQSSSETLRELHLQGTVIQDARVQAALLDNPRAPVDMIVPLMDSMRPQQLYRLCAREDLPHETRVAAAYALREGYDALSPQERIDVILRTEGASLLLAGLTVDEDVTDLLCGMKFESTVLASNLAQYPGTPLRVLQRLYQQPVVQDNLEIKNLVRQNPNWPR